MELLFLVIMFAVVFVLVILPLFKSPPQDKEG